MTTPDDTFDVWLSDDLEGDEVRILMELTREQWDMMMQLHDENPKLYPNPLSLRLLNNALVRLGELPPDRFDPNPTPRPSRKQSLRKRLTTMHEIIITPFLYITTFLFITPCLILKNRFRDNC